MTTSVEVRGEIVAKLRRDLIGPAPGPEDTDIATEVLKEVPSRWYLAGFLAPEQEVRIAVDAGEDEERETEAEGQEEIAGLEGGAGPAPGDDDTEPEAPTAIRRFTPSSVALTVLVPQATTDIEAVVTWGDYRTEPPLPRELLVPSEEQEKDEAQRKRTESDAVEHAVLIVRQSLSPRERAAFVLREAFDYSYG